MSKSIQQSPLSKYILDNNTSVDPKKHPDEIFDLYSIPAYDKRQPEVLSGSEIGSTKKAVEPNDIMLSRIVPHIRRVWIVGQKNERRQIASGEWIIFRSKEIVPGYIRFFLLSDIFHRQFMNTVTGVGGSLLRAQPSQVEKITIPSPPLPIQKRIAEILEKADAAREKRRQTLALTEQFLQSAFLDMFGDPVTNPKGWEKDDVDSLCDVNPRLKENIDDNLEVSFVPMAAVDDIMGGIVKPEIRTFQTVKKGYTYFRNGDVLLAKITPCMENGKAAIAVNLLNSIGFGSTEFHVLRPRERVISEYIFGLIRREAFRTQAAKHMSGTAGQQRVPTDYIKQLQIPVPPLSLQQKFAALVEKVEVMRAKQRESERELEQLFQSLMQRAFRQAQDGLFKGELVSEYKTP